jgi:hypothetical protein
MRRVNSSGISDHNIVVDEIYKSSMSAVIGAWIGASRRSYAEPKPTISSAFRLTFDYDLLPAVYGHVVPTTFFGLPLTGKQKPCMYPRATAVTGMY